jgi:hypothetical protein
LTFRRKRLDSRKGIAYDVGMELLQGIGEGIMTVLFAWYVLAEALRLGMPRTHARYLKIARQRAGR